MHFVFNGFHQNANLRHYRFERVTDDRTRDAYSVMADLTLLRKYEIGLQDAPLLCLRILENADQTSLRHRLTFSEDEMRKLAADKARAKEAAALKPKSHRPGPKANAQH